jgi:hypothetical protein
MSSPYKSIIGKEERNMRLRIPITVLSGAVLIALAGFSGGTAQASAAAPRQDGPVVVASGLNNPRQISVARGGLLVAEAGAGGSYCYPVDSVGDLQCAGNTGSISWVPLSSWSRPAYPVRLVTGLPSFSSQGGFEAFGPSGVAASGFGKFYFAEPGTSTVTLPPGVVDTTNAMKLMWTRFPNPPQPVADLGAFQVANNFDQQGPESNPYSVLALPGEVLVADAGANDVVRYQDGQLSLFKLIPGSQAGHCAGAPMNNVGCDSVPTAVAVGPDGNIYVGCFYSGAPGTAMVYVLNPRTARVVRQITGLTALNGLTVGPDGSVYVSQLYTEPGTDGPDWTTGNVTRICPDGTRTSTTVPAPGGLAIKGHSLYVSAWSISPADGLSGQPDSGGQIWRLHI